MKVSAAGRAFEGLVFVERERERERRTDRETDRKTDRQTERQTERQTGVRGAGLL